MQMVTQHVVSSRTEHMDVQDGFLEM